MAAIADLRIPLPQGGTRLDPREAELLLSHVLGKPREYLLAHPEAPVPRATVARYRRLLQRFEHNEPLPYLLGEAWFYGRPFAVNSHVLIPRPETELLVELALNRIKTYRIQNIEYRILDIGTGSGCIAITLAAELPRAHVIATDVSPAALRVARANARRHGVEDRIAFVRGNLLDYPLTVSPHFNDRENMVTLVGNLPYLTTAEWRALPRPIRNHEPREALDGGPDGLTYFRKLFEQLAEMQLAACSSKLQAFLEIDPRRKRPLTALARKHLPNWEASWHRDLAGHWRILELQRSVQTLGISERSESTS